jgi:type II secretory pathway pseudopilin PulG
MKKWQKIALMSMVAMVAMTVLMGATCESGSSAEKSDRETVNSQQEHYQDVQPIPFFDFSNPRDVLIQIYKTVTTEARNTYTVIQSMTGEVVFYGPSIGYAIPADTQLTNGLQPSWGNDGRAATIEQAEPNGLFSSENTDGTWVLFVDLNGDVTPVYTEQKVTTYPYAVVQNSKGAWVRADDAAASVTIDMNK